MSSFPVCERKRRRLINKLFSNARGQYSSDDVKCADTNCITVIKMCNVSRLIELPFARTFLPAN